MSALGQGGGDAQTRQLLMGASPTQMNLETVRTRATELRAQVGNLRVALQSPANAAGLSFNTVLKDFAVIGTQYGQLMSDLRPQLQFYVAHPMQLTEATRDLVPEQLSTLLLPEMTAAMDQLLKARTGDGPSPAGAGKTAVGKTQAAIRQHNEMIQNLQQQKQCMHEKSTERKTIVNNYQNVSRELQKALTETSRAATTGPSVAGKVSKATSKPASDNAAAVLKAFKQGIV